MDERVAPLVDLATHVAEQWQALTVRWATSGLPEDKPYDRLHGATFKELGQRLVATLDLVLALKRVEDAVLVMFLPRIQPAMKQLKAAQTHIGNLLGELNSAPEARFVDPSGNLDVVQGSIDGRHVTNATPGSYLDQISANAMALFDLVYGMLKFGKGKGLSLYQDYGLQLQSLHSSLAGLQAEAKSIVASIESLRGPAEEAAGAAAQSSSRALGLSTKIDEFVDSAQKSHAEVEAKLAAVREVSKAATSLEAQIEAYESSFDAFQKSLDDRLQQHEAFQKYSAEAKTKLEIREQEIERLTAKSEAMIKGATTAGLGHSLDETRKLYERRMSFAGIGFFVSILLLAVSAIPLMAHILPGLFASWLPQAPMAAQKVGVAIATTIATPTSGTDALLGLLGKIFLMFPATWLTQFFSKAYSEFFHLEREYAHKAALAKSVEGFKLQAPKFEEEITTAVFFEVQANPSKQQAPDPAEHPILGPLMKKFVDALPFGKPEAKEATKAG